MNISKILILVLLSTFVLSAGLGNATLPGYMDKLVSITDQQTTPIVWNASNFDGFNYNSSDLPSTETLTIVPFTLYGPNADRIIEAGNLTYTTTFVSNEYPIFTDLGLYVNDDENGYRTGYLNGKQYVAIANAPDKLATPLVEFDGNDVKTLRKGDVWDIGGGFSITALEFTLDGNKVLLQLDKNGAFLDDMVLETGSDLQSRVWTYDDNVAGEDNIPVLSLYLSGIMQGEDIDYVQIKYLSLIDNNVSEIVVDDNFGNMKVTSMVGNSLELSNWIYLNLTSDNSPSIIMENMSLITLYNSSSIEFYPSVDGNETSTLYDISGFISGNYSGLWNLSENYTIALQEVDIEGEKAMFTLLEDGVIIDQKIMTERLIASNDLDSTYQYIKNGTQIINATLDFAFYGFNSDIANLINVYQWSDFNSSFMFSNESHIFESTTSIGIPWNLSEEYTLTMKDVNPDEVWFQLSLNDDVVKYDLLNEDVLNESVYTSGNGNISYVLDYIFDGINAIVVKIRNVDQYSDIDGDHLIINDTHFYKTGDPSGIPLGLSNGYTLTMKDVDLNVDKVWFQLSLNDDVVVEYDILNEDILNESVYTSENGNISYVLDSIFDGTNESVVKIRNVNQYDIDGAHLLNNSTHLFKTGNPVGIPWDVSENYTFTMKDVDSDSDEVWFEFFKDGESLKEDFVNSNALFSYLNDSESFNFSVSWVMDGTLADVVKIVDVDLYSDAGGELLHNGSKIYATSNPSGEIWQLSEGYSLDPKDVDVYGNKVWLSLSKDDTVVMDEMIDSLDTNAGRWFNYSNSSGELVFSTFVDAVFRGHVDNLVDLKNSTQYSEINGTPLFSDSEKTLRTGITLNNNVNHDPVATSDTASTNEDTSVDITLSASDVDGDSLTYLIVDNPSNGTVTLSGNTANYTPSVNYNGSDSFTFKANDSTVDSDTATISITVNPVNDAPVATSDTASTAEDTSVDITLSASDVDGDSLTYFIVDNPSNGNVTLSGNTANYTPSVNYNGSDSFTFKVNDSTVDSDTATISITVNPVNDAPVADSNGPYTGIEGTEITFDGSGSFDPDGNIDSYNWDFGDGTNGTGETLIHVYGQDGIYIVNLIVIDNDGVTDSDSTTVVVAKIAPTVTIHSPSAITNNSTPLLNATFDQTAASWYVIDMAAGTGGTNADNLTVTLPELEDGQHTVKVYANNSYGNVGFATKVFLVDTIAPTVHSVALNDTIVQNGTSIEVNVSATDDVSAIVSVTANGSALDLTDGYYIGNITAGTSPVIVNVTDEAGNIATDDSTTYTIDNDAPVVNISKPQQNSLIRFVDNIVRGNVTDVNLASAYLIVRNATDVIVGSQYDLIIRDDGSFIKRVEYAPDQNNTLELNATDLAGNSITIVNNISVYNNTVQEPINVKSNNESLIDAKNKTDVQLVVNANINKSINVKITAITNETQLKNLNDSSALKALGKMVEIYIDGINASNATEVNYVTVRMYYTKADLDLDGDGTVDVGELNEDDLSIYWYNDTNGNESWVKLIKGNPSWVNDVGRNDTGDYSGYVWAEIRHLSIFGLAAGSVPTPVDDGDDDAPTSSSGGGGGGGASGEAFENIEVKDVAREYVVKDTPVTYSFKEETNAIGFIKYDAKSNPGEVAVMIEVLKGISTMVSASPSGEVYQNMNIWVGMSGYATEANIANPVIGFKVAKSWITENDIDESTIKLNRYSSGAWNKLPTTKTGEDASYIYFSSETPGFSPFAITGDERSSTAVANAPDSSSIASIANDDANEPVGETTSVLEDEDKSSGGFALVVGLIGISVLGVGMYLRKDEIGEWIKQRR